MSTWEPGDEEISFVVNNSEGRYSIRHDVDARLIYSQAVTTTFELMEWLAAENAKHPEPIKFFKLTQGQLDQLKASAPPRIQAATFPTLLGIPLEIVEDVRDSTPFKRWWEDAKAALAAHHERAE